MSDDVTRLPVKFKGQGKTGQVLEIVRRCKCLHFHGNHSFLIDKDSAMVECGGCGEKLNPMSVLTWLAQDETRWHEARARYQEEMKRLDERSRTKCDHCDKMTRISRR